MWKVFGQAIVALKVRYQNQCLVFVVIILIACTDASIQDCHRRMEHGDNKPIIHRDLKPANILYVWSICATFSPCNEHGIGAFIPFFDRLDSNQNIKIGDFGLAKELSSQSKLAQTNVGTPYYMVSEYWPSPSVMQTYAIMNCVIFFFYRRQAPEIINERDYDERSDIW